MAAHDDSFEFFQTREYDYTRRNDGGGTLRPTEGLSLSGEFRRDFLIDWGVEEASEEDLPRTTRRLVPVATVRRHEFDAPACAFFMILGLLLGLVLGARWQQQDQALSDAVSRLEIHEGREIGENEVSGSVNPWEDR